MSRIGLGALALALSLVSAPRLHAQASTLFVCRDGQAFQSANGRRACAGHGGISQQATAQARRNVERGATGGYGSRGVYGGGNVNGTRGVYGGGSNGANGTRGVYGGGNGSGNGTRGVYGGGNNGGVYGSNAQVQCADGSWSTVGVSGCDRRGGAYDRSASGANGQYDQRRRDRGNEDRNDGGDRRKGQRGNGHDNNRGGNDHHDDR